MSEHELPASVRVALWGTAALTGRLAVDDVPRHALPDLDECTGLVETLQLWATLGERTVLAALPRPGDVTGMPQGPLALLDAATQAEECVYVPGVGGALVPRIQPYGPTGDVGWLARWELFDAEPVPRHRVEALDLGQIELELRTSLATLTEQIAATGAPPFGPAAEHGLGRARAVREGAGAWGLPDGLPARAARVLQLAGTVLGLTDAGLGAVTSSLDSRTTVARDGILRRLQAQALAALTDATNAGAVQLGYRT